MRNVRTAGEAKIGVYLKPPSEMTLADYLEVVGAVLTYPSLEASRPRGEIMGTYVVLEAYDGAPLAVAPDATAFFHRNTVGNIYFDIFTSVAAGEAPFREAEAWMRSLYAGDDPKLQSSLGTFELNEGTAALWRGHRATADSNDGELDAGPDDEADDDGRPMRTFEAYQNYVWPAFGENERRYVSVDFAAAQRYCRSCVAVDVSTEKLTCVRIPSCVHACTRKLL